MDKSLDRKLAAIHANPAGSREFILADAKDADMALGLGAAGRSPEGHTGELRHRTLEEYREQMRLVTRQAQVDIVLMSASSNHALTIRERLFDDSPVTPAVRANDTTDIHLARGARYSDSPARPFRSASLDHIQCGHLDCLPEERALGADLGLYSVTFNNDLDHDLATLERFHEFRIEAERKNFRYFLEVFDPNVPDAVAPDVLPGYLNDMITRMLAGIAPAGRPLFLKVAYHGPKALEELVRFDPHLIVGILGGPAGTTRDAFQLLADAQKYGARVALFGRKINQAENQLAFIQFLRLIVEGQIGPLEAVKAYHAVLRKLGLRPHRASEDDLKLSSHSTSHAGTTTAVTVPPLPQPAPPAPSSTVRDGRPCQCPKPNGRLTSPVTSLAVSEPHSCACHSTVTAPTRYASDLGPTESNGFPTYPDGRPDFTRMDVMQRLAYHRKRLGLGD